MYFVSYRVYTEDKYITDGRVNSVCLSDENSLFLFVDLLEKNKLRYKVASSEGSLMMPKSFGYEFNETFSYWKLSLFDTTQFFNEQ